MESSNLVSENPIDSIIAIRELEYSPLNGNNLLVVDDYGTVRIQYLNSDGTKVLEKNQVLVEKDGQCASYSHNGEFVLIGSISGDVQLCTINNIKTKPKRKYAHDGGVIALAFSYGDTLFATSGKDSLVKIWNTKSLRVIDSIKTHDDVWALAFTGNSKRIVLGCDDENAYIWKFNYQTYIEDTKLLSGHTDYVRSVAIDTRTGNILTSSNDNTARVWGSIGNQKFILTHDGDVYDTEIFIKNDTSYMLTASKDKRIRRWKFYNSEDINNKILLSDDFLIPISTSEQLENGILEFRNLLDTSNIDILRHAAEYYDDQARSVTDKNDSLLVADYTEKKEMIYTKIDVIEGHN